MIDLRVRDSKRGLDINLSDHGFIVTDIQPSSISIDRDTRHMLGTDGVDESVVDEMTRDIQVNFSCMTLDKMEYIKKTDFINMLFGTKNRLIITRRYNDRGGYEFEKPNAAVVEELPFFDELSWDVGMNGSFEPQRNGLLLTYSIKFTTVEIPYGFDEETVITLTAADFVTNIGGSGQIASVDYLGTKDLNQLKLPMFVMIKRIKAASRFAIDINGIINISPPRALVESDILMYDGYGYYLNQGNQVRNTNKGYFELKKGKNQIKMDFTQTTDFEVELTFRNYYY